jgi:hypothetical protein
MRAELFLLGKRIDMAPRRRRRWLVALIYFGFAALMTGFWFMDQWHTSAAYLILATIPVNRLFLGGYYFGGLIKPFNNRPPKQSALPPPVLLLKLRVYLPVPATGDEAYRNDERELGQRNLAHYRAYQALSITVVILWALTNFKAEVPRLIARLSIPVDMVLYGLVTAAVVVAITLPQAILLWTEPDMEEDFSGS